MNKRFGDAERHYLNWRIESEINKLPFRQVELAFDREEPAVTLWCMDTTGMKWRLELTPIQKA